MAATMAWSSVGGVDTAGFAGAAAGWPWWPPAAGKMPASSCKTLGSKVMAMLMSVRAVKTMAIPVIDRLRPWASMTFCMSKLNMRKVKSSCELKWTYNISLKCQFFNGVVLAKGQRHSGARFLNCWWMEHCLLCLLKWNWCSWQQAGASNSTAAEDRKTNGSS